MAIRFIHTADIHLGKTYRNSPGEHQRYNDFFKTLGNIVADAVNESVDFMLICGDLFHHGRILPRTFARTIETLQPLKDADIPCICIEGNHDWIHRRENISWMEALSEMGYIRLLRPSRTEEGGYWFDLFDDSSGRGGWIRIKDLNIYGLGYIGAHAGSHVERICEAVDTTNNLLLFHVGIWQYCPVEIGNMKLDEAHPLADKFGYVALGHGHKPYTVETPEKRPYGYNPGAPERVNFGEQNYEKGYYLVETKGKDFSARFRPTQPRPMIVEVIGLEGTEGVEEALRCIEERTGQLKQEIEQGQGHRPLVEIKLVGRVGFFPFELGRERLYRILDNHLSPLHVEIKNHLSLTSRTGDEHNRKQSLDEIERDVLHELIVTHSGYKERVNELVELSLTLRDHVLKGGVDEEELMGLLSNREE